MKKALFTLCISLLLCSLLMTGCASSIRLGGEKFRSDAESISAVISAEELPLLSEFENLKSADLSGSSCYSEMARWAQDHPETELIFTLPFPGGVTALNTASEIDLSSLQPGEAAAAAELLACMPGLESINIGGNLSAAEAGLLLAACPRALPSGEVGLMGKSLAVDSRSLKLSGISHEDAQELLACLPYMYNLKSADLGSDSESGILWEDIKAIESLRPELELSYDFSLYGQSFDLNAESMDFRLYPVEDDGQGALEAAACMPKLKYLDMDSCGISNERMAEIRDSLPGVEVVWRVWFGDAYSVRTDVERILASNPGLGGDMTEENSQSLIYCNKVKYLDIGHNDFLDDMSFVSYMPDLEVLIIALSRISDLSPLADCPKLEYLEVQLTAVNDLRPLAGLKNLRHLNIGYCYALTDISPLFELPELERVWIGQYVPVPPGQIEKLKETAPHCDVNTSFAEYENWRYTGDWKDGAMVLCPRYALLREQMQYGGAPGSYAYFWNDPLCPSQKPAIPAA